MTINDEVPFSQKSIQDQLIHLIAAQYEIPVPKVHSIGQAGLWRSVNNDDQGKSWPISLYSKDKGVGFAPILGKLTPDAMRNIALHLLVAAETIDSEKDQGAE